jgi:hypothetical protein
VDRPIILVVSDKEVTRRTLVGEDRPFSPSAVYAAPEGLDTLVLEPSEPGGQAGTSSTRPV